jgi:hypothetical protein
LEHEGELLQGRRRSRGKNGDSNYCTYALTHTNSLILSSRRSTRSRTI